MLVRKPLGKVLAAPNGDYALRRTVVGEAEALRARLVRERGSSVPGVSALTGAELRLIRLVSGLMRGHRMSFRGYRQDPKVCDT